MAGRPDDDWPAVETLAHNLRGVVSTMSALHGMARDGVHGDKREESWRRLEAHARPYVEGLGLKWDDVVAFTYQLDRHDDSGGVDKALAANALFVNDAHEVMLREQWMAMAAAERAQVEAKTKAALDALHPDDRAVAQRALQQLHDCYEQLEQVSAAANKLLDAGHVQRAVDACTPLAESGRRGQWAVRVLHRLGVPTRGLASQEAEAGTQEMLADVELAQSMAVLGVSREVQAKIRQMRGMAGLRPLMRQARAAADALGIPEAIIEPYVRVLVAYMVATQQHEVHGVTLLDSSGKPHPVLAEQPVGGEAQWALVSQALDAFRARHSRLGIYYADGLAGARARLVDGLRKLPAWDALQRARWQHDYEEFLAAAARHEHPPSDVQALRDALAAAGLGVEAARAQRVLHQQAAGPAHLQALEHQWAAFEHARIAVAGFERMRREGRLSRASGVVLGTLQVATTESLLAAEAYTWAPMCVEAVASAAATIPGDAVMGHATLGPDFDRPGLCGWWWFQQPVPLQTLETSGDDDPVVALLWRREFPKGHPQRVWFQTFVLAPWTEPMGGGGHRKLVATPTASWLWEDGVSVEDLPRALRTGYDEAYATPELRGAATAGVDVTLASSTWFSRFFLMALVWLRQRVVVTEPGQGVRQVARGLQRQHKLAAAPKVQVVHLRRRAQQEHAAPADGAGPGKKYDRWRWAVRGHARNQPCGPGRADRRLVWIETFEKGNPDAPFKTTAKVYAVVR